MNGTERTDKIRILFAILFFGLATIGIAIFFQNIKASFSGITNAVFTLFFDGYMAVTALAVFLGIRLLIKQDASVERFGFIAGILFIAYSLSWADSLALTSKLAIDNIIDWTGVKFDFSFMSLLFLGTGVLLVVKPLRNKLKRYLGIIFSGVFATAIFITLTKFLINTIASLVDRTIGVSFFFNLWTATIASASYACVIALLLPQLFVAKANSFTRKIWFVPALVYVSGGPFARVLSTLTGRGLLRTDIQSYFDLFSLSFVMALLIFGYWCAYNDDLLHGFPFRRKATVTNDTRDSVVND